MFLPDPCGAQFVWDYALQSLYIQGVSGKGATLWFFTGAFYAAGDRSSVTLLRAHSTTQDSFRVSLHDISFTRSYMFLNTLYHLFLLLTYHRPRPSL